MNVRERLRRFILDYFYVSEPEELSDDTSLIESGTVDSTGMMEVILFLESEFGIEVEEQDTTPENLETIARIAAFVAAKRRQAPAGSAD